jgi:hypothetical protein
MRVVLCRPPFVAPRFGPPIGLLYLSSVLKEHGHEVVLYDISVELFARFRHGWRYDRNFEIPANHAAVKYAHRHMQDYCAKILSWQPDVVGFSLLYCNHKFGIEMAKQLCVHTRCIAGGPQCTFREDDMLDVGCFDAIVSGYGEEAILDALCGDGVFSKSLSREREYLPDFSLVDLEDYGGRLPLVTTRGCPNRCNFCTQNSPYYYHRIGSITSILRRAKNIKRVMLNDPNINVNPERTKDLFSQLALFKIAPVHVYGMQVKEGFEEYVHLMAKSGVTQVRLGIESGSLRERVSMNKPRFTNELALELVKRLTSHRIEAIAQFIFCYPDQTEGDRQETLSLMQRLNKECDSNYVQHRWLQFVVHHGTEEFFERNYGVTTTSPNTWENALYNPREISRIGRRYERTIPENCRLAVDYVDRSSLSRGIASLLHRGKQAVARLLDQVGNSLLDI